MTSGDFTETVTMDTRRVIAYIFVLFGFSECVRQCVNQRCRRRREPGRRETECKIEDLPADDFTIVSIGIAENDRRTLDRCVLDETYKISGTSIEISGRCSGEFEVCFETDPDDDVTSPKPATVTPSTTTKTTAMPESTDEEDSTTRYIFVNTSESISEWTTSPNNTFIRANVSIAIPDKQQRRHFIKIAGILGAVVGVLTFMVLSITVVVIQQKRLSCLKIRYKRREPSRINKHRSVTSTASEITTVSNDDRYDSLQPQRNSHKYQQFKPQEPLHTYMTVYDTYDDSTTLTPDKSHTAQGQPDKQNIRYDYVAVQEEIKSEKWSSLSDSFQQGQYNVLDPVETGFAKGLPVTLNYELAKPFDDLAVDKNTQHLVKEFPSNEENDITKSPSELDILSYGSTKVLKTSNNERHSKDVCCDSNLDMYNIPDHGNHKSQDNIVNIYNHAEDFTYVTAKQNDVSEVTIGHYDFTRAPVHKHDAPNTVAGNYDHIC